MEIHDNKTGAPLEHYCALFAAKNCGELSSRSGVQYNAGEFHLSLLSRSVKVLWPGMELVDAESGSPLSASARILLGRLILEGTLAQSSGKFLAYSQLPWGSVYTAQFNARCVKRIAAVYGSAPEKLDEACAKLGGRRISGGDTAWELEFLPGLFIRVTLWQGDEEFPASAQVLFSDNFPAAFTAEDTAVVGDVLINALKDKW